MIPCAFYTMSDARFFIGAVALVNSLRLVGHEEPIYLLDCGLESWQRELLSPHVELVPAPPARSPILLTFHAPLTRPAELMVSVDADIIAVRSLHNLMERSVQQNKVLAFIDAHPRFDPRWREVLDLESLRQEPYVTNAVLVLPGVLGREVLESLREGQERVDFKAEANFIDNWEARYKGKPPPGRLHNPFFFPEQDVLNALLSSRVPPERQARLEYRLAPHPPFPGLHLVDRISLRCEYTDGVQPYVLHHVETKPWLRPTRPNLYSDLLPRLLFAPDLAIILPPSSVPRRFRPTPSGSLERARLTAVRALTQNGPVFRIRSKLHLRTRWHLFRERLTGR